MKIKTKIAIKTIAAANERYYAIAISADGRQTYMFHYGKWVQFLTLDTDRYARVLQGVGQTLIHGRIFIEVEQ